MSYARLQAEILAARERREAAIAGALARLSRHGADAAVIFASLNLPGADKSPPGAAALLAGALAGLGERLAPLHRRRQGRDALGPYALLEAPGQDAVGVKRRCVALEGEHPAMRLLDLDVYAADGRRLGRRELGFAARRCFLCERPAAECIRLGSHNHEELVRHVHGLLGGHAAR